MNSNIPPIVIQVLNTDYNVSPIIIVQKKLFWSIDRFDLSRTIKIPTNTNYLAVNFSVFVTEMAKFYENPFIQWTHRDLSDCLDFTISVVLVSRPMCTDSRFNRIGFSVLINVNLRNPNKINKIKKGPSVFNYVPVYN